MSHEQGDHAGNVNTTNAASDTRSADDQIRAHRAQHQQKIKKIAVLIVISAVALVLMFILFQLFENSTNKSSNQSTELNTTATDSAALTPSESERYRDEFKRALADYEVNIQPLINQIKVSGWQADKVSEISLLKERTVSNFAQSALVAAKQNIETLSTQAQQLIENWQAQTDEFIALAKQAFDDEKIPQAQLNINKALNLMPANPQAIGLQARIDAFAEVAKLLDSLQVAKVENNLSKQIDLLNDIIQLDPQRNELNQDLAQAQSSYNKQQLARYLERAEKAIAAGNLIDAEKLISSARAIKPNSEGAKALQQRIDDLKSLDKLAQIKQQLAMLSEQDQWQDVAVLSAKHSVAYSNDSDLFDYQQNAQAVLRAKKSLEVFLSSPPRLADQNIRDAASEAVQKSFGASLKSPSLQKQIAALAELIDSYSQPVEVTINSDGKTYILVLGVGHVGEHTSKTIELNPGDYVLQGSREGFRNKRLEISVKANSPVSISLICDEKI